MTDRTLRRPADLDALTFDDRGLLPVIAQDARSGDVLMVAWANREALERTLAEREAHFWSRSRQELWRKGGTSGHVLHLRSLHADCDGDTVLALVDPDGPACHTGEHSCFGAGTHPHRAEPDPGYHGPAGGGETGAIPDEPRHPEGEGDILNQLWDVIHQRARNRPEGSYTTRLLDDENLRLKKLGEESAELLVALSQGRVDDIPEEGADLLYHVLVALQAAGSSLDDVRAVLERRRR